MNIDEAFDEYDVDTSDRDALRDEFEAQGGDTDDVSLAILRDAAKTLGMNYPFGASDYESETDTREYSGRSDFDAPDEE